MSKLPKSPKNGPKPTSAAAKTRLAEALRDNLRRRKDQERARERLGGDEEAAADLPPGERG